MKLEIQNANYNYLDNSQYLLNSNNSINSYIIKTQPVQSTNSRVIQQQCAMTNEETRSLTGVVAKTRALFESNSSNCDYSSPVCPLGREISSSTRQFNSNLRTNTSYNKSFMKPSFSANNVNNIVPKLKLNSVGSINENESDKENTKANNRFARSAHINHLANLFNSTTPSSNNGLTTSANYAINHKINSSAHNLTNDCLTANISSNENLINDTRLNQDSIFKPTFLKLRRFESPSLSQSHLLDHMNDSQNYINNSSRSSHSNQPPTMTQSLIQNKSTSSNRISLASSSTSSASSSSVANELAHTISKFKPSYNNNNGLWSSSIETSKEFNIPTSVKQAKACFESLAASNSSLNISNKAKTNSTTSSISLNTPNKQPNPNSVSKVRSDLLLSSKYPNGGARIPPMYPTPPQSAQQTNQFKSTVIPITNQRKSLSPSPLNESSNNNNNNSEMLVKSYSSSNGLVGVSEMINLFSSSSSSNSSTNNSNYNSLTSRNLAAATANNQLMIPSSSSSSSSPIYNSNSSASSCETTPRSSELQQATNVATYPVSVSIPISRSLNLESELNETPLILNENHHDDEFKLPNVAERIRNLEKSSVSVSSLRNNYLKLASANNDYLNSQSENVVGRVVNKMSSTPSSSSSASSFSSSSSYLNNSNLSNTAKPNDQSLNKYSPKFVKAYQRFEDNQNKYRKLEDIINEADSSNSTIIKIKSPLIENQAQDNELDENEPEQKPVLANIKSILRKAAITPSPVCFSLNKPVETTQQIQVYHAEVNSQKTLPININRIVQECTTVYSSSIEKPNNMYNIVENRKNSLKKLQETNYDRLNFVGSNGNEDSQVKVDSTSCVLPSKLRQNSQSLADPCEDLPKNHSTPKTPLCRNTAKTGSYVKNASPHLNGSSFNTSTSGSSVVKRVARNATTAREALLRWCRKMTEDYPNVTITNFSSSWSNGLAFCALIHHFIPDAFDYSLLDETNARYNFELAFRVAEEKADIVSLLDVDDMIEMGNSPDWKCVFTYVHSIYQRFKDSVF